MNQSDLVHRVAGKTGFSAKDTKTLLRAALEQIAEALAEGDRVRTNLGVFSVNETGPYRGRNPRTGEAVMVEARRRVRFRPSQPLKNKLNGRGP